MVIVKSIGEALGGLLAVVVFALCVLISIPIALFKSASRGFKCQFDKYCKYYNGGGVK